MDTSIRMDAGAQIHEPVVVLKPWQVKIGHDSRVDAFVKIEGGEGVSIGPWVHIASFCHVNVGGGRLEIGEHVSVASGAAILSGSNQPDAVSMSSVSPAQLQHVERRQTRIEAYAFVGAGAILLPGVTIGKGAVVGAGAVVTKDVPAGQIWAGVPARQIGTRLPAPRTESDA